MLQMQPNPLTVDSSVEEIKQFLQSLMVNPEDLIEIYKIKHFVFVEHRHPQTPDFPAFTVYLFCPENKLFAVDNVFANLHLAMVVAGKSYFALTRPDFFKETPPMENSALPIMFNAPEDVKENLLGDEQ